MDNQQYTNYKQSTKFNQQITIGICLLLFAPCVYSDDLVISGIMKGARPMAIVNGKPVGIGENVAGAKVTAIHSEYVVFEINGQSVTKTLTNETVTSNAKPTVPVVSAPVVPVPRAPSDLTADNLHNEYATALNGIQEFLGAHPRAIKTYDEALRLYDDLDRYIKEAIAQISDGRQITFMRGWLKDISEKKATLYSHKSELNSIIEQGKRNKNPVRGMTKDDIRLALGSPDYTYRQESEARNVEDWSYYKQSPGYYLRFDDGILIEISTSRQAPPASVSGQFQESQKQAQDGFQAVRDSFKF